jgi:hypothetical protein
MPKVTASKHQPLDPGHCLNKLYSILDLFDCAYATPDLNANVSCIGGEKDAKCSRQCDNDQCERRGNVLVAEELEQRTDVLRRPAAELEKPR